MRDSQTLTLFVIAMRSQIIAFSGRPYFIFEWTGSHPAAWHGPCSRFSVGSCTSSGIISEW